MKDSELRQLYQTACHGKGYEPNDGQFKLWKQTLGWCEERDLAQALVWYFEANSGFPMPADLKPLAERARRTRTLEAAAPKDVVIWQCPDCGVTMTGFVGEGESIERRCAGAYRKRGEMPRSLPKGQVCGARMQVCARTKSHV